MAEHDGGLIAPSAFYIHEVGIGGRDQTLQLVGILLVLEAGVQQVGVHLLNIMIIFIFLLLRLGF